MAETLPAKKNKNEVALEEDSTSNELDELRKVLLAHEKAEIEGIKKRLNDPEKRKQDISEVLPDAIKLRLSRDKDLSRALTPILEDGVSTYVRRNPQAISDAIMPTMGLTLKSLAKKAFRLKLEAMSKWLGQTFSFKGLKWRIEAIGTSRSFDEVALLNSLLYRVEQVFVIHKESGTVLQHVSEIREEAVEEAEMFSATLRALQAMGKSDASLDTLQLGDYTVWVEQSEDLILAGVIRGTPSMGLRSVFQSTLKKIQDEHRDDLVDFDGNVTPFQSTRHNLMACLQIEYGKQKQSLIPLWTALILLLCAIGVGGFFYFKQYMQWKEYVDRLHAEPGIVVTKEEGGFWNYFVSGLRDPAARDPEILLQHSKIDPGRVIKRWEQYYSLDEKIIVRRARQILNPPDTLRLRVQNGILYASGSVSPDWIKKARKKISGMPGIMGFQEENLFDDNSSERLIAYLGTQLEPPDTVEMSIKDGILTLKGRAPYRWIERAKRLAPTIPGVVSLRAQNLAAEENRSFDMLKERMEKHIFLFRAGAELVPGQDRAIRAFLGEIREFNDAANALGRGYVAIIGHTDKSGSERTNIKLSQQRADAILSIIRSKGIDTSHITAKGIGSKEPVSRGDTTFKQDINRSVTIRVFTN